MRFKSLVLLVMLVLPAWPVVAGAVVCAELPERADQIRALRDHDAAGGVARGRALLEELDAAGSDCPAGRMLLQSAIASNLHIQGQHDAAIDLVNEALTLIDRVPDPTHRATVHRTAGVIHWEAAAHDRALEHYHRALENSREAGDHNGVARTAGNIGNLHNTLGNWEEAERYHLEALEAFEAQGWEQGVAGTLVNLGALAERRARAWELEGESELARAQYEANLDYNRRALAIFERLENPRGIAYAADNVAKALISLGRPEEALDDLDRSLALQREVGDNSGVVQSLLTRADALAELDEDQAAFEVLDEAYSLLPEGNRTLREEVINSQIDVLAGMRDFEAAFERQRQLMAMQRDDAAEEVAARVEELEARYRASQLEKELALERARAEVSEQRARRQWLISVGAIVTAFLLLLVAGMAYSRFRLGQKVSRKLDHASRTDPLTGLSNRRDMTEQIEKAIERSRAEDEPSAVIMADIDNFKEINDTFGHQAGDAVLIQIANLFRDQVRGRDVAARWGGEEFLVLLPGTERDGAIAVSENLRTALAESPPHFDDRRLTLTMTFGVASIKSGTDSNTLIKQVDDAMYAGKVGGKNRVVASDAPSR